MRKDPQGKELDATVDEYRKWRRLAKDAQFIFFPVYRDLLERGFLRELLGGPLNLYVYLGLHAGNETGLTWVSVETMAEYFQVTKRTVQNWLSRLEQVGLIRRLQVKERGVTYTVLRPPGEGVTGKKRRDGEVPPF